MRLESPQVVEVLAREEQDERGAGCRLVGASRGFSCARQQLGASIEIADVRRRHGTVVRDRVAERHVPGLETVELAVEVPATGNEAATAVGHARQRLEREGGSPDARRAADERGDILDAEPRRRTLV